MKSRTLGFAFLAFVFGTAGFFYTTKQSRSPQAQNTQQTHRIVSLNGTITETLFALGLGGALVGRDTSSYYPAAALKLPTVGYQHRLNAEGILRLKPTLVVGLEGVKPASVLQQIKAAGTRLLLLPKPNNVERSKAMIRKLGQALGRKERAQALCKAMEVQLQKLRTLRKERKGKPPVKVMALYVRGTRMRFALGRETTVGGMLSLVGATHSVSFKQARPLSAEALIAARPDVIVAFSKGVASIGGRAALAKLPGIAQTPAGKQKRFVVMDDLYLGGFGPRTGDAGLALFRGIFATAPKKAAK